CAYPFLRHIALLPAKLLVPLAVLGRHVLAEVLRLEHLTDLDFGVLERSPLQPLDGLFHRRDLPQPEASHELLRLGEWPVDDRLTPPFPPAGRAPRSSGGRRPGQRALAEAISLSLRSVATSTPVGSPESPRARPIRPSGSHPVLGAPVASGTSPRRRGGARG